MTTMNDPTAWYRAPWNAEREAFIVEWWPHFGTYYVAEVLGLTRQQVKSKADHMGLHMLPKSDRLCIDCRIGRQFSRYAGLRCSDCHLGRRRKVRRIRARTLEQWVSEATNTARHRSSVPSDLTAAYMLDLWDQQQGICFYSGLAMRVPAYGAGRDLYSASIDRLDPLRGYLRGNVVWCTWICNAGKSQMSVHEYITLCSQVVHHRQGRPESDRGTVVVP
jgi:hypothetical protein